ncbi:hypothetical protein ABPG73_019968 [Tetrahymena malaccensis]
MIFKSDSLLSFFVFLVIQSYVKSLTTSVDVDGCIVYTSDKYNICTQCLEGYELDSKNNICIYTKCSNNLFYDKNQKDVNSKESGCVAVCSTFSYKNQQSNICQSKLKCSFQKPTQLQLNDITQTKDFFIYQQNYYVIQKGNTLSLYDKNKLNLIKYISLQANDLNVLQINGVIFLIGIDNSISVWDIKKESKKQIIFPNEIFVNSLTEMISIDNVYVLAFNINSEKKSVFQIFYDLSNQELCLSNSFTVDDFIQFFKIIDQWLFTQNQNTVFVKKISIFNSNNNLNLQIQNNFQFQLERNSNYFNILSSSQLGVYVLVQDQSAYLVNLIINSYKSIEIQYIEGELIQRSKIFEAQDTDLNVFLIALTSQYLIYTNLQTNQSNYIKLNYLYYMKDLEIFNLWGNEKLIIAIDQQNRLEIIQFDSSSQQFFLKDQISNLYYIGTDLLLVRYQNQSSTQKQLIDELVIKGSDNIQIIQNQGSLLEEQNQLIKMNVITNFNLQFPTSLQDTNLKLKNIFSKYKSNYYSPLILMSNSKNNQTYWYDCTEKSACKLYKQLRLNKNYERLFLFSRYIIFSDINYSYLMDIFTSQVKILEYNVINYSIYNNLLVLFYNDTCFSIFSSEMQVLIQSCELKNLSLSKQFYLNNNYMMIIDSFQNNFINVYQINFNNKTVQKVSQNIKYKFILIIKTFPSLQDQINDKYFINQIAILDESSNFLIYNFTLSQIYKLNSKIISGIKQINIVVNDRNTYVLQGKEGVLFINIQDNTQNLIKTTLFFDQIEKKVNELGKMYYQAFNFLDSSIEEYIIDIDTKIVRLLSTYQVNSLDFLPYYVQNFKNTNITLTRLDSKNNQNTFYPSYVQISNNRKFTSDKNLKNAILNIQSSKLFVLLTQQVTYIDIYSGFQETIFSFANPLDSQVIKQYADFIILQSQNEIILINTYSNEKYVKNYPQQLINNVEYSKNDKLIYIYGNFLQILDTQLKVVQDISNVNQDQSDFICNDFQFQFVCLNTFFSDFKELFVYDKIQNTTKTVKIDNAYLTYSVFDEIYQNIFIYENQNNQLNQIRIYSSNGVLKQTIQISVSDCLILIDRDSLAFNKLLILEDDSIQIRKFIYIEYLNFLLLQLDNNLSQISIYDVSAEQFVYKIQVNLNQLKNNNITYFQYDESQSSYVMLFDSEGKFYLSSIDSDKPFQNFINICNGCDQTLFEFISHDCLQNQIYLRINESVYQFDYELLGIERDPVLNEPFSLFTSIYISETLTDYLILSQNNVVFRYSQNQLKTELSIIKSDIQSIKYNQKSDVLVLALADSILLYKQYQFNIKNQIDHDIQLLDIIQFQQFITDSVIITFDQKILHLNVTTGEIMKIIQFNTTQIVTSFNINNNQDLIIIGFSDGQILQYNLANQIVFLYNTTLQNPINVSIITIQLIEISVTKQFAYAASNAGILFSIDLMDKKVISQMDLRVLVKEDPKITLSKFLIDQTYQRFIFCFNGQKKVYVWNYQTNQQERNLPLPKKQSTLRIEKNFLIIQCIYQINLHRLSSQVEFVALVKKDFLYDTIIDFKLFENNVIALLLVDRFELFIVNENKFNMIAQINYEYPRILTSQFDSQKNIITILGLHKTGVFENSYNLDSYKSDSVSECSFLISSQEQQNIIEQQAQIVVKQKEIETIHGVSLINYNNQLTYLYLQIPAVNIQNALLQISQLNNSESIIAPYNTQNNFIILSNNTFQNLNQSILQFTNFSLTFQNDTNLFININQNKKTQEIIFQNMAISFACFGTNQIYISDVEKVVFLNIKIYWLNLKECSNQNQLNSLFFFYNVSEIFIYNLEISNNNFYQKSQVSVFQFQLIKNVLINWVTMTQNINLSSLMSFYSKAQNQCVEGCSVCINSNNQNTCTKCQESYELDLKNNICVYTKCSSNLFYDKNYLDDSSLGNLCLAICGEYSYKNELNNLCQNKQKCSIQRSTSQYMDDNTTTINFYIYQNNYYVLQKEDQLSVYNRFNLNLIKNIKLEARDLQVFNVNNAIFIIGSDNSITLLDIISESRIQKKFTNMISVNSFTQIDQINNQYILVINFQIEKEFECQIFYDSVNQIFTLSNSIIINVIPEKIKFVDQWLVIQSQNNIIVYEIIISKNNLNLNLQINNHFIFSAQQNSDYFDILFTNQLGIYILVQDKSACFVNLNNNSFKPILIDLSDKQYILKSRMFQPSFSDLDQYLIISSNESLVFTNLQTNISNSIKIFNMPYFDFEISNLWGNEKQIVVLWENVNLSFYQLDQKLQIFIELNQKFVLNYQTNNRLYQLNYQSKSQAQKEYIYELVTIDDSSIQIINRESNPSQQQTQLIQINVITNFNLPFPTVALVQSSNFDFSGLPSFIVISYIPPLVISLNDSQEINFYDYSEIENLKFQQQLKISSNLLTIQKFSSNKIIALEPTMGYIIDINTKNVVNIFYTDRCQYATNSNYLAIIYENCLIIKSEEMNTLFNNCQTGFQDFNFNIYLNDDLKIITQEKSGQYISVFQLDLQNQSIQFLNKITNIKLFQIIKSFSTFQDEINNSFSIEQIVIIDQNNSFKIYNFSLSLIYQMNQLNVTQIKSINQVVNELQIYVVQGYEGILLLNVTSNTQILIKSNFKFNGQSQIKKKLNQDGQIQYQKYEFYSTTIVEYIIDIQQNQVVELGNYQVNQTSFLSAYIQNVKNTNINQINYFGNDNTELMFTSYVQNPYAEILIDKISKTVSLDLKNGKLYLYSQISNSIIQFDIYTRFSQTLYTFKQNLNLPEFKYYEDFLLIFDGKNIFLINIFTADNYVKNNLKINNAEYSKDEKVIYVYTTSSVSILDTKLNIIQELFNYTDDLTCINFKCQIVCYCTFPIDTQAYFLIIDKVQKIPHYIYSEQEVLEFLFDQEYENIFVFPTEINLLKIYSSDGNLKQIFEKIVSVCRIFTLNILCESDQSLLLIDRITLTIKSKIKNISYSLFKNIYLIENLNYLIFQNKYILSQISVYDITAQAEINQIKIERQTEFKEIIKQQLQVDTISTSYVMFLDQSGTFYLCSLNPSFHFYSYIKIYEPYSTLQPSQFIYDGLSNNIYFSYQANVYILDYYLSGQQNEPQLNEPYNLFSQINVNSQQVDYLILSQGNLIFRYSQQKLQFELSIIQSRILDIKYNEKSDVLILGLVDSILFYQQYQLCKNGNLDLNIQQLEAIQFQQFITDSIVITYNHQILHLNILKGAIIKEIQFNVTQIVTSFNVNKNQDLIIIGFSDGQLLQYNLASQIYFLYNTTQIGPLNISIFFIQITETSNVEQIAYAISNSGLLFQIDILNKKVISQTDLRVLVKEDPATTLSQFLIDQTYQRYIFSFSGQKKAYVWNYSNNQQEAYLSLPKKESKLRIEQNFLFIQCIFQINLYTFNTKIEFVSFVKKNVLNDTIIDFKLFVNNVVAILLIDRFELYIIDGDIFTMIAQISYQYPRILSYSFDTDQNMLYILGMHKAGVFQNIYNLNIHKLDSISECSFFSSIQEQQNILEELASVTIKKNQIQTINGVYLINQDNYQIYNYIEVPAINIQNTFLQVSQFKSSQFVIAPYDEQNKFLALTNDTFYNFRQSNLQLNNFSLTFQNDTNLFVNITQNKQIQQVVFQNMVIEFACFGTNQIYLSDIEKNHIEENFQRQIEYLIIEENTKINENTDTSYLLGLDILNCYSNITSLSTDLTQYSEQNLFNYILQVSKFDQLRQLNLKLNTSQIKNNIVCYYKQQFENLKELNELSLVVKSHDYYEDEYLFPSLVRYTTQISKLRLQLKTIKLTDALYKQLFEVLPSLKHLKQIYFNFGQGYLIKFNHQIFGSNLKKCKNLNSVTLDFENIISPKKTLKDQTQIILQNESLNSDKDTKDTKTNLRTQLTSIAIAKSLIENHIKKKLQQTLYQNNAYKKASRLVKVEIK